VRTRRPVPVARIALGTFAIAVLAVAGLSACSSNPGPTPSTSPSAVVTPTQTPSLTPTPTPSLTPSVKPTVKPAAILLSSAGIGDVKMGTVDPVPALVKLLGPANGSGIPEADMCGPGNTTSLMWPDLVVHLDTSAGVTLWGWELRGPAAPAGVTTKSGVVPGAPLSAAIALPGAAAPIYWDVMDALIVDADGVTYWGQGSDPAKSTISDVAVNGITCD